MGERSTRSPSHWRWKLSPDTQGFPLIGLKGERRSGKDTIGRILLCPPHGYRREAFADDLKREIFEAFGRAMLAEIWELGAYDPSPSFQDWMEFVDDHKNDPADAEFGWIGPILQFWGTEYRRNRCGEDYWLRKMEAKLGPRVVVTDVRFPNEADLIRAHGGFILHVERPGAQNDGAARSSSHASEALIDSIPADCVVHNDSTFEELIEEINQLVPYLDQLDADR